MQRPFRTTELEELSRDVTEARAAVAAREHASDQLAKARRALDALDGRIPELELAASRERKDVEKLERPGAAKLLHTVLGNLAERQERERQELAAATLTLDQARAERAARDQEIAKLTDRIKGLADVGVSLERARAAKIAWLEAHDEPSARMLAEIASRDGDLAAEEHRLRDALGLASEAHDTFRQLSRDLERAESERGIGFKPSLSSSPLTFRLVEKAAECLPRLHTVLTRLSHQCHELGIESGNPSVPSISSDQIEWFLSNRVKDPATGRRMSEPRRDALDGDRIIQSVSDQLKVRFATLRQRRAELGARREALLDG